LKKLANAYSINENVLKHETLLVKEFGSERVATAYVARTFCFIYSSLQRCVWLFI